MNIEQLAKHISFVDKRLYEIDEKYCAIAKGIGRTGDHVNGFKSFKRDDLTRLPIERWTIYNAKAHKRYLKAYKKTSPLFKAYKKYYSALCDRMEFMRVPAPHK